MKVTKQASGISQAEVLFAMGGAPRRCADDRGRCYTDRECWCGDCEVCHGMEE